MLAAFIPIIVFAMINVWVVVYAKKKFGEAIPVTILLSAFFMFFGQLIFRTFSVSFYLLIALAAAGIPLLIINYKNLQFRKNYFSNGFICFVFIALFVLFIDYRRTFAAWDEFSHWGKMVKEMLRLDKFYSVAESDLLVHKEYPPFVGVFEVLWCKLQGGFSERATAMAVHFMEFSLLIPYIFEKLELAAKYVWQKAICAGCFVMGIVFVILLFDASGTLSTIYIDLVPPILFAYAVLLITNDIKKGTIFGYVSLLLTVSALILTKQISIAFIMLIWLYYTFVIFSAGGKKNFEKKLFVKKIILSVSTLILPAINYFIWSKYTAGLGLAGQFNLNKIKIFALWGIARGRGTEEQNLTFKNFIYALFSKKINTGFLELTYFSACAVALAILILCYIIFKNRYDFKKFLRDTVVLACGSLGYAFTMLILYLYCFSETEMVELASYQRYMSAYVLGQFLIIIPMVIQFTAKSFKPKAEYKRFIIVLVAIMLLCEPVRFANLIFSQYNPEPSDKMEKSFEINAAQKIQNNTEPGSKIFFISAYNVRHIYYINYYLENRKMDSSYLYDKISRESDTEYWEKVIDTIYENDYLYIYDSSESVKVNLDKYMTEGTAEYQTLYKINRENGKLVLRKI